MAQVILKNVTKRFPNGVEAVKNVTLDIEDKEFMALVGPSGCGKSTTLRMVAGLEEITEGEILIDDKVVNDISPKNRNIAMVFQNYALYPHMSVFENMAFGLKLRRYPKKEINERVKYAAEILGIGELFDRKPRQLSGGQKQRVAVGRAIVRKPVAFLFDEPLSNLDAKFRVQMRTEIIKLHNRLQTTMIYVTHDQIEAMTMGSRIAVMEDGLIQQVDEPIAVYDHPVNKFVAGFIGSPAMNFMEGKIIKQDGNFAFDEGTFRVQLIESMYDKVKSYEGKEVTFGIRPEDIYDRSCTQLPGEGNTLSATVDVVEPMGSEVYLYLTTTKSSFVAKVGVYNRPKVDQKLDIVFDMNKIHIFDKGTEETIV